MNCRGLPGEESFPRIPDSAKLLSPSIQPAYSVQRDHAETSVIGEALVAEVSIMASQHKMIAARTLQSPD